MVSWLKSVETDEEAAPEGPLLLVAVGLACVAVSVPVVVGADPPAAVGVVPGVTCRSGKGVSVRQLEPERVVRFL